jgi:hypothetical protein
MKKFKEFYLSVAYPRLGNLAFDPGPEYKC